MKILEDRILVRPIASESKTAGGLIIPTTAKESPQQGEVVLVGSGSPEVSMEVAVGDSVIFGKRAGTPFEYSGDDVLLMRQTDILAIL